MSDTIIGKITAAVALIAAVLILIFTDYGSQTRIYDCGMAEWHPDILIQSGKNAVDYDMNNNILIRKVYALS